MKTKTFREFQTTTVQAAVTALTIAKVKYDEAPPDQRARITAHHSTLLLEAPTGSGKTLMAAAAVEQFTQSEDVVWFWFAPFKGVIAQTLSFLKGECSTLRLRDLGSDRRPEQARRGDVFVTSWQSVAVRDTSQRTVRRERESAPSLDLLISGLREKNLRIGIVVDEAHHSFSAGSQAAALCREVLKPDYTLLVTATPDDRDIDKWKQSQGVQDLSRLSVSRADAVKAGLIKEGVKAVAFKAAQESQRELVDYEGAALSAGVRMHRLITQRLSEAGISLKPLLMVQVDSEEKDSVQEAKNRLIKLGFAEDAIVTHTAAEPDPGLAGLPNDESKEVLIFKMAVAQGFDIPRAWCLVTMRSTRDENFGVQIIGRILRVHRRLFGRTDLPEVLNYGYVFLARPELQSGLEQAGDRLNEFRTQCGLVAPTRTALVTLGGKPEVQQTDEGGQTWIFTPETPVFGTGGTADAGQSELNFGLEGETATGGGFEGGTGSDGGLLPGLVVSVLSGETGKSPATGPGGPVSTKKAYCYALRPNMPKQFKTCLLPEETGGLENECARHFFVSSDALIAAMAAKVAVHQTTVEVFTHLVQLELLKAEMDAEEVARRANELLSRNEGFTRRNSKPACAPNCAKSWKTRACRALRTQENSMRCCTPCSSRTKARPCAPRRRRRWPARRRWSWPGSCPPRWRVTRAARPPCATCMASSRRR